MSTLTHNKVAVIPGASKGIGAGIAKATSQTLADGWRTGVAKAFERRINAIVLEGAQIDPRERL